MKGSPMEKKELQEMYFRVKSFKGFFDGMEEVEAHEPGAIRYIPAPAEAAPTASDEQSAKDYAESEYTEATPNAPSVA